MKKIIQIVALFTVIYIVYNYFFKDVASPRFIIINHTTKPINFSNLSLRKNTEDHTYEELELAKHSYKINAGDSNIEYINSYYWNNPNPLETSFGFSYVESNQQEIDNLEGAMFSDISHQSESLAHCQFTINVYPDKTTVIHDDDNSCSRPMHYLKNK